METTIRIKSHELTPELLTKIKALFKDEELLEIAISPVSDFGLTRKEGKKAYTNRINKAIENLEANKNTTTLTENEFDALINDLLDK